MKHCKETILKQQTKRKIKKPKSLKKICDDLWSYAVKLRAGNKSELSGQTENLQSHHLIQKTAGYRLRYELENGICLTQSEHFSWHKVPITHERMREQVKTLRGENIFQRLADLKPYKGKTDLKLIKLYLENEINQLELDKLNEVF